MKTVYPYVVAPSSQLVKNGEYCLDSHSLYVWRSLRDEDETNKQKWPYTGLLYALRVDGKQTHIWCARTLLPNPEIAGQTPAEAVASFLFWNFQMKQIVDILDSDSEEWVEVRSVLAERLAEYESLGSIKKRTPEQQGKWHKAQLVAEARAKREERG